ncbi:hypothetical protein D3C81_1683530 [compost metagenome]
MGWIDVDVLTKNAGSGERFICLRSLCPGRPPHGSKVAICRIRASGCTDETHPVFGQYLLVAGLAAAEYELSEAPVIFKRRTDTAAAHLITIGAVEPPVGVALHAIRCPDFFTQVIRQWLARGGADQLSQYLCFPGAVVG